MFLNLQRSPRCFARLVCRRILCYWSFVSHLFGLVKFSFLQIQVKSLLPGTDETVLIIITKSCKLQCRTSASLTGDRSRHSKSMPSQYSFSTHESFKLIKRGKKKRKRKRKEKEKRQTAIREACAYESLIMKTGFIYSLPQLVRAQLVESTPVCWNEWVCASQCNMCSHCNECVCAVMSVFAL